MSLMYLHQDILQHGIVPILEPEGLVSFSMVNRLFRDIVLGQVSEVIIERVNNMMVRFFGKDVDKVKQFMNDTEIYMAKECVLQCIVNEYWLDKDEVVFEYIYFCGKNTCVDYERNLYDLVYTLLTNLGWKKGVSYWDDICVFEKEEQLVHVSFVAVESCDQWLSNFRSRYYVENNKEMIEIVPAYGSIIKKTVKYDVNMNEHDIDLTLNRLKNNGFKINANLKALCGAIDYCELFEVSLIDCTYMDDGKKLYNCEYLNGKIEHLEKCNDVYGIHVVGNMISFIDERQTIFHSSYYDYPSYYICPVEICGYPNMHFHGRYMKRGGTEYDCIFIVV